MAITRAMRANSPPRRNKGCQRQRSAAPITAVDELLGSRARRAQRPHPRRLKPLCRVLLEVMFDNSIERGAAIIGKIWRSFLHDRIHYFQKCITLERGRARQHLVEDRQS